MKISLATLVATVVGVVIAAVTFFLTYSYLFADRGVSKEMHSRLMNTCNISNQDCLCTVYAFATELRDEDVYKYVELKEEYGNALTTIDLAESLEFSKLNKKKAWERVSATNEKCQFETSLKQDTTKFPLAVSWEIKGEYSDISELDALLPKKVGSYSNKWMSDLILEGEPLESCDSSGLFDVTTYLAQAVTLGYNGRANTETDIIAAVENIKAQECSVSGEVETRLAEHRVEGSINCEASSSSGYGDYVVSIDYVQNQLRAEYFYTIGMGYHNQKVVLHLDRDLASDC